MTSPIILIPSPGPGNGWRNTSFSGIPNCNPACLTSSLNRSRNGSMISLKSTKSGSPPTLWWDLMTADSPPNPLSTTSVSYTHLDVYKRQVPCGIASPNPIYTDASSFLRIIAGI